MNQIVALLAFAVVGCLAETDPKCAWGESYWCNSLRVAKNCGAVDHCRTTVWANQVLKQDVTEVCQFCESIVGDVRKYVQEQKTRAEISQFMTSACGIIPQQKIADECKYVVQFMIEEFIQLVVAELDPQMICSLMGICSGLEDSVVHSPISSPADELPTPVKDKKLRPLVGVHAEPICSDCKKFFTDIKTMLTSNHTETEVETMIDDAVCSLLGSMEEECKSLVHEFLPEIMEYISNYYDPNVICSSLGVCASLDKAKNLLLFARLRKLPLYRADKLSSPGSCVLCETVMMELQTLDRDPAVQANVLSALKTQFCERLGSLKVACVQAVDSYGPELFELLATELDPKTRCSSLGFCSTALPNEAAAASKPMLSLTPSKKASQPMMSLTPSKPAIQPAMKLTPAKPALQPTDLTDAVKLSLGVSPQCVLCEFIMKELKSLIGDNATEAEIMAGLEKVCSYLPKAVQNACTSFVDVYGPAIIELLLQELDPEQVCTELGLCGSKSPVSPAPTTPKVEVRPPVGETETCVVCETIIQYLEALLEQNATEVEIEMILERICTYLPDPMGTECENIVKQYGDLIIHYITTFASPKEVCSLIGVCSSKKGGVAAKAGQDMKINAEEIEVAKKAPPMLGQNECSWGPSYWCASRENADKCNAVDHCKKKVWNQ